MSEPFPFPFPWLPGSRVVMMDGDKVIGGQSRQMGFACVPLYLPLTTKNLGFGVDDGVLEPTGPGSLEPGSQIQILTGDFLVDEAVPTVAGLGRRVGEQ